MVTGCLALLRRHVRLHAAQTPFLRAVVARCPSLSTVYSSPWWLLNGHAETIYAWATRKSPNVVYYRRCLSLPDGGVISLDFDDSLESQVRRALSLAACSVAWQVSTKRSSKH